MECVMKSRYALGISIILMLILIACSGSSKQAIQIESPAQIINSVKIPDMAKSSEVHTFAGQTLYEYIDGGAEVYHQYGFIEVSTADFKSGNIEITADVYKFDNADDAFGMYSMLRPKQADFREIGVQGFASESNLDFVKGQCLIRLLCYDMTPEAATALTALAAGFDKIIPGSTAIPAMFDLLPLQDRVINSEIMTAESYLGQAGLNKVYTADYQIGTEQCQLFILDDNTGENFTQWEGNITINADAMKSLKDLPFDPAKIFLVDDPYYGKILAGLKGDKLLGCIGYRESMKPFINDWLNALGSH